MTAAVVGFVALALIGFLPSRWLFTSTVPAILASPIVAAFVLATFASLCVVVRASLLFAVGATLIVVVASAGALRRGSRAASGHRERRDLVPLLFPLGALVPLLTLRVPPVGHDARSIWAFHASWFGDGGSAVADAMQNAALKFAAQDYPPFASATAGAIEAISGSRAPRVEQGLVALMTVSAVCTLAWAVWRLAAPAVGAGRRRVLGGAAGIAFVLAVYGVAGAGVAAIAPATNGYVDILWSSAFAAAAILLLASPMEPVALRAGSLLLGVSALTKNEGLVAAVVLLALALVRWRGRERSVRWLGASIVPGVLWVVVVQVVGAPSESSDGSRYGELLSFDTRVLDRFRPIIESLWSEERAVLAAAALITVLGLVVARRAWRETTGTSVAWLWGTWLATTASIVLAYLVSPHNVHWHLRTSVDRTTNAGLFVLIATVALWTVVAARVLTAPSDESVAG